MKTKILIITLLVSIIFISCNKDEEKPIEEINQTVSDRISKRWHYYAAKIGSEPDTTYFENNFKYVATFTKPNIYSYDLIMDTYNQDSVLVTTEYNNAKGTWEIQNENILKIYSQYYQYTYGYDSSGNYIITDSVLTDNNRTQEILELYNEKLTLHETIVLDDTTSMEITFFYKNYIE